MAGSKLTLKLIKTKSEQILRWKLNWVNANIAAFIFRERETPLTELFDIFLEAAFRVVVLPKIVKMSMWCVVICRAVV